ncbi:hypothetical protein [Paraglaciecola marina]|uniref:hypothetical protein n=1 Tax=Paraglaciecola marina TaxID=2500157 RepID=UPI001060AC65|nr:hypothetical protein [Paraglaciecola marina]
MSKLLIIFVPIVFLLTYCQKNIGGITASHIDESLTKALKVGDSQQQVEHALSELSLLFEYDKFSNRYQAIVANDGDNCMNYVLYDCSVGIFIHTDDELRYKYHEVDVFYSGL